VDGAAAHGPFRVTRRGEEMFTLPRLQIFRTMLLNHWYHHRGQLTVYLRMLDIELPAVYGRSADEENFGAMTALAG
jgi:uncharacterized damage-inducible protein DinB